MPNSARIATVALGSLGVATAIASGATASAQTVEFPQTPSLFYGGLCGSNIRTWADTSPDSPGRAVINVQALPIQGMGSGPYPFAPLCNVDTTVVLEAPKLAPHKAAMEERLGAAVGAAVSVKAKRAEGLGALGRGEGVACWAVALVESG